MQTAQVRPWLPGTSASGAAKGTAMLFGALVLFVFLPLTLLDVGASAARGGHLPWPALQWVLTTPLGTLLLTALCMLVIGPPVVLVWVSQLRRDVAQAIDITGVPPIAWHGPWPTRPQPSSKQRWLGHGRREQALSLTLLILGMLLAIALVGIVIASSDYGFYELGRQPCRTTETGCPPDFPLTEIAVTSMPAVIALTLVARSHWLRRVEATTHVWLRYRAWLSTAPLYYVRQPSVTPEAAAAALARFSSAQAVPLARLVVITGLVMTPYVLVANASFALSAWLQFQWLPG